MPKFSKEFGVKYNGCLIDIICVICEKIFAIKSDKNLLMTRHNKKNTTNIRVIVRKYAYLSGVIVYK